MSESKEFQGKNLDEAIEAACRHFDLKRDKLEIEIVSGGSSGIFGLVGVKKAVVRAKPRGSFKPLTQEPERRSERAPERPVERAPERPVERTPDRAPEKSVERPSERPAEKTIESAPADVEAEAPARTADERPAGEESRQDGQSRRSDRGRRGRGRGRGERSGERAEGQSGQPSGQSERSADRPGDRQTDRSGERQGDRPSPRRRERPRREAQPPRENREPREPRENDENAPQGIAHLDQAKLEAVTREVTGKLLEALVENAQVSVELQPDRVCVKIEDPDNTGLLIGREGQTLAAIQYLVNRLVSKRMDASVRVQIDAGDYRENQDERLRQIARHLADKAMATGRTQSTRPMSSYHRRVVHLTLQDDEFVFTRSKGEGAMKRVLIMPKRKDKDGELIEPADADAPMMEPEAPMAAAPEATPSAPIVETPTAPVETPAAPASEEKPAETAPAAPAASTPAAPAEPAGE